MRVPRICAIAVAMTLVTCTPKGSPDESGVPATSSSPSTESAGNETSGPVTMAQAKACPVTLPSPAGPSGPARDAFFGWGASYGNGTLWVGGLWPDGIIAVGHGFVDDRGRVGMKFGWWTKVAGRLEITGRRLDGPAPPVGAVVPDGYGGGFRPSGVTFPTEGCWEITGSVHRTELSFVTFVIRRNKGS